MVVLVALLTVPVMGVVVTSFAQSNAKSAERSADTSVGEAVAEAAMNHARSILWSAVDPLDPAAVPAGQVTLFGGTGTYSGQLSGNVWTLTGVSTVMSGVQEITRTVSTQVPVEAGGDGPAFAVFTGDSDCGGGSLDLSPDTIEVSGALRTNGDLEIGGKNVKIGLVSAYGPPCEIEIKSKSAELATLGTPPPSTVPQPLDPETAEEVAAAIAQGVHIDGTVQYWPAAFDEADFVCTHRAKKFSFGKKGKNGKTIPDGVYCADESFTVTSSKVKARITVVAPKIEVKGSKHDLTPYSREVLFYATGTEPMKLSGSEYQWAGIIFHPNGRVEIRGDEFSMLRGMIEAKEVKVNGKAFRMVGTGPRADLGGDGLTLVDVPGSYRSE